MLLVQPERGIGMLTIGEFPIQLHTRMAWKQNTPGL